MQNRYQFRKYKRENKIKLFAIAAACRNRVIGSDGQLPWRLPSDLARFKKFTQGHHMIIGRSTYESIGRPLPGRMMIIVTSDPDYKAEGSIVVNSIEEALHHCPPKEVTWVVGGSKIYTQLLPYCDVLHLTEVQTYTNGGGNYSYFPDITLDRSWYLLNDNGWSKPLEKDEFPTRYSVWARLLNILEHQGFDPWAGTII